VTKPSNVGLDNLPLKPRDPSIPLGEFSTSHRYCRVTPRSARSTASNRMPPC